MIVRAAIDKALAFALTIWTRFFPATNRPAIAGIPAPIIKAPAPASAPPANSDKPRAIRDPDQEEHQAFYFRDDLLDQLHNYFIHLKNMKKVDRDSYDLYCKIGASILPRSAMFYLGELSPWFRMVLPSFGAVVLTIGTKEKAAEDKQDRMTARFIYFTKYDRYHRPADAQPASIDGTFYIVSAMFDDPKDASKPLLAQCAVLLTGSGQVIPLKQRIQKKTIIRHKRGRNRTSNLIAPAWEWPALMQRVARENKKTFEHCVYEWFLIAANGFETAQHAMTVVSVKSHTGVIAKFGVDVTRTPYFFKDREAEVDANGRKRKIFHIVGTHARTTKTGKESFVKAHFRGLREFTWNGYQVRITVPFRDNVGISEFNVPAMDSGTKDLPKERLNGTADLGRALSKAENRIFERGTTP